MSHEAQVASIILFFLSVAAFYEVLRLIVQWRYDLFHNRLLSVRNFLFDTVMDKEIPFDHDAYVVTKNCIDALIQSGFRINSIHIFLLWLSFHRNKDVMYGIEDLDKELRNSHENLPEQSREIIQQVHQKIYSTVASHLPILALLIKLSRPYELSEVVFMNCGMRATIFESEIIKPVNNTFLKDKVRV